MVSRKQLLSKIGEKEDKASSKTDEKATFAKGLPADLEKQRVGNLWRK